MSAEPFPSQAVMNCFVLVTFHMSRGNALSKKVHLLRLQEILLRIADDKHVLYITIIPIRPGVNSNDLEAIETPQVGP